MRLGPWHRWLVIAALALVAASGVLWFVLRDGMDHSPDELLHELLVVHGVTAYASAVAFGSILPLHAMTGWRLRRHLMSGLAVALTLSLLIGSALLLYYGGEEIQAWARLVHIAVGFCALLAAPWHIVLGHRARIQKERNRPTTSGMQTARREG